jgi:hypothetical protein
MVTTILLIIGWFVMASIGTLAFYMWRKRDGELETERFHNRLLLEELQEWRRACLPDSVDDEPTT